MKRIYFIYLLPVLMTVFSAALTSCGDNDDFSKLHVLTDEEIRQMEIQDSILKANLLKINADLVEDYTVQAYPASQWDAKALVIDFTGAAEVFGLTPEEVVAGINQAPGAPAITGFAIQGTTHEDYNVATNTNNVWGHWWRYDGDVCAVYNEDASRFYCEWAGYYDEEADENVETYFNVGQLPGTCVAGNTFTVLEGLKYNEKRVVYRITYEIIERGQTTGGIVGTQQLSLTTAADNTYATVPLEFDLNKACSDLGVSSLDDLDWVATNADGSYAQEYTATPPPGFYFDLDGNAGTWGDNASVFVLYEGGNTFSVGQMPDQLKPGDSVTVKMGAVKGDKIEMFEITVNIVEFEDPETPPAGDPYETEVNVTLSKPYSNDYAAVEADNAAETIKDALKMTTYQIYQGILSGDVKVYLNEVTEEDPEYTAGDGEYWIDEDGNSIDWGNGLIYAGVYTEPSYLGLEMGCHPDNCSPNGGHTVNFKLIVTGPNGGKVTFNITAEITAAE